MNNILLKHFINNTHNKYSESEYILNKNCYLHFASQNVYIDGQNLLNENNLIKEYQIICLLVKGIRNERNI